MIIDDIVNELDRFITKYKGLKTDNQNLTQFKTDVKTALNSKGIIATTEDSEVVNSINSYNPPSGGTSLDAEYLKKVGLLPYGFTGTLTERDLRVAKFLIQDTNSPNIFYSTQYLSDVTVQLDGEYISNFRLTRTSTTSNAISIEPDKYIITNEGYYINNFMLPKSGNYHIHLSDGVLSLDKTFEFVKEAISKNDFLMYAVNLKSNIYKVQGNTAYTHRGRIYTNMLDGISSSNFNNVTRNLNNSGSNIEKLGYVYNVRTGKAFLLDERWDSSAYPNINSDFKENLSITKYNNKIYIMTSSYSFGLLVKGSNETNFISDIDYKDGDTLAFALYKERDNTQSQEATTEDVAEFFKKNIVAVE